MNQDAKEQADALTHQGLAARRQSDIPTAIKYYTASLNCYPTEKAHYNRALAYLLLEENDSTPQFLRYALNDFLAFFVLNFNAFNAAKPDRVMRASFIASMNKSLLVANLCYLIVLDALPAADSKTRMHYAALSLLFSDYEEPTFTDDEIAAIQNIDRMVQDLANIFTHADQLTRYLAVSTPDIHDFLARDVSRSTLMAFFQFIAEARANQ